MKKLLWITKKLKLVRIVFIENRVNGIAKWEKSRWLNIYRRELRQNCFCWISYMAGLFAGWSCRFIICEHDDGLSYRENLVEVFIKFPKCLFGPKSEAFFFGRFFWKSVTVMCDNTLQYFPVGCGNVLLSETAFFFVKNRVHGVMNHKFANIRKLVIVTSSDLQGTYVFFSIFLEGRGLLLYVNGKKNTQL